MKKITSYSIAAFAVILLSGCYYDVAEELYPSEIFCDTSNAAYSAKVLPIIQDNCYSCHSGTAPTGNISLDSYGNLKAQADNGKLIGTLTHAAGFSPMPKG